VARERARQRAMITGASSGIGEAFARRLAADGYDLVLVARRLDRLEALAAELTQHSIDVQCIRADLVEPGAVERVVNEALARGAVDMLVNNAGFGMFGPFAEIDLAAQLRMIQLNVVALVELTHRLAAPMRVRKSGSIIQIASTAAFQPVPYDAVYGATKAFVLAFGEAIHEELRHDGVHVLTLCPGPVATEFTGAAAAASYEITAPTRTFMPADRLVAWGMWGLRARVAFLVAGVLNWFGAFFVRFAPRFVVRRFVGWFFRRIVRRVNRDTQPGSPPAADEPRAKP
jgi:uncharacterized protein